MNMVFSTKMKSAGQLNNIQQNNNRINLQTNIFFSINMIDKIRASVECGDCKKAKPIILK